MLNITDQAKFNEVIEAALIKTADNYRWQNAVKKAVKEIEENGTFMEWDSADNHLLIWSQGSNEIYTANGVCQCKAFEKGFPCFHRAASRLVKNYLEQPESKPAFDPANAPYIKQLDRKPEYCGNIRF